ncbi:MAG TPA: STAS domain-containing protein [Thermoguttaceae bacterium]|nr:STAS domain-containing protein [Thermoguttaceae bacterium]
MLNVPSEIFGDVIVVHAPEELAGDTASQFASYVPTLDRKNVVADVDSTEIIDSEGLAALLGVQEALQRQHGQLKIAATNATNRKILEITRIDQQIDVFHSVLDAVKSFQ